jgi:type II secretory pathway pseudopilin PulG
MVYSKAFSTFEVVVVLIVLSFLAIVGISKFGSSANIASTAKIKSDIALIRTSLQDAKTQSILQGNSGFSISSLDDASINTQNEKLFIGVNNIKLLSYPIFSSSISSAKSGDWVKLSSTTYRAYLSSNEFVDFEYAATKNLFECNYGETLCQQLSQ